MSDDAWADPVDRRCDGDVTSGSMLGRRALRTGRRFFAIWWTGHLVVKLPPERIQELVASSQTEPFQPMPGRRMNGWVVLGGSVDYDPVVAEARAWVEFQQ